MQPLRLGIIGTGIATRELHWPALRQIPDRFQVVALCNRTRAKAESFAALVGGSPTITTDYRELLRSPGVDAVDISVPIALNAAITIEALQAGKHVFVEKPIAGDLQSGLDVVAAADAHSDLVLLVGENVRYEERFRRARQLIEDGAIGRPVMLQAEILSPPSPSSPYLQTRWRINPEHLGGFLSDGGVHQAAALQMLGGRIESVQGIVTAFGAEEDADTLLANLRFASGSVGHLTYSVGVRNGEPYAFRVYGTAGMIAVGEKTITLRTDEGRSEIDTANAPSGYRLELEDFYEAVVNRRAPAVSPRDALDDLAVIDAAFVSSRSGEVVPLPAR